MPIQNGQIIYRFTYPYHYVLVCYGLAYIR